MSSYAFCVLERYHVIMELLFHIAVDKHQLNQWDLVKIVDDICLLLW